MRRKQRGRQSRGFLVGVMTVSQTTVYRSRRVPANRQKRLRRRNWTSATSHRTPWRRSWPIPGAVPHQAPEMEMPADRGTIGCREEEELGTDPVEIEQILLIRRSRHRPGRPVRQSWCAWPARSARGRSSRHFGIGPQEAELDGKTYRQAQGPMDLKRTSAPMIAR